MSVARQLSYQRFTWRNPAHIPAVRLWPAWWSLRLPGAAAPLRLTRVKRPPRRGAGTCQAKRSRRVRSLPKNGWHTRTKGDRH